MLAIRNLSRPGLAPVDLDVDDGEAVAVLGPSGAGKSLFLRAIADLDPNQGTVSLDGRTRDSMPAPRWRRLVTYLPAEPGWWGERPAELFPDPTAARALMPALGL
ncbi:MAG: ATP-binding cassette domain-containing protein, partial [Alphaproteobacteria bacterium]